MAKKAEIEKQEQALVNTDALFDKVSALIEEGRKYVSTAVNLAEVYSKYQIGKYIVEEEQAGNKRAGYGKQVLLNLSERLMEKYGDGWSLPQLKLIRQFYAVYSKKLNAVYPIRENQESKELVVDSERLNTVYQIHNLPNSIDPSSMPPSTLFICQTKKSYRKSSKSGQRNLRITNNIKTHNIMITNLLNNLSNVLKKGTSLSEKGTSLEMNPCSLRAIRYAAVLFAVLVMSVANIGMAWAWNEPHFYLTGETPTGGWSNSATSWRLTSPSSTALASGTNDEYCTYMWLETDNYFGLNNGTDRYSRNDYYDQEIKGDKYGAGVFGYPTKVSHDDKAFKYIGTTGLVRINAAQSGSGDSYGNQGQWYPYIWVEESLETDILNGSKIMFYFGISTSWGCSWLYLSKEADKTTDTAKKRYFKMKDEKCSSNIAVAYVDANTKYYISNNPTGAGIKMSANAVAGNLYSLNSSGGDNIYVNEGSVPHFSTTSVTKYVGTTNSTISATASNSIYGNSQTLYYYYTTDGGTTFTKFDPTDISGLGAGTYTVYALGWDGHILVRSDNSVTLTIQCPTNNASGTAYKFQIKSGLTNTTSLADFDLLEFTSANYLDDDAVGGSLYGHNANSKLTIVDTKGFCLTDNSKSYFKLTLDCPIQEGDIIKYIFTEKDGGLYKANTKSAGNLLQTLPKSANNTTYSYFSVSSGNALIGKDELYLFPASTGTKVYYFEIIRPLKITMDENGGSTLPDIYGFSGDKVVLPHTFKTDNRFKGWFTSTSGGTQRANYYTIVGAEEVHAQWEDIPASGDLFTLRMESSMAPASDVTIPANDTIDLLKYATVYGGAAVLKNTASSTKGKIAKSTSKVTFNGGNDQGLHIHLDFPILEGDTIITNIESQNLSYTNSSTRSTTNNFTKGTNQKLVVGSTNVLKNSSHLYIWSASTSGGVLSSIKIKRPAKYTINYAAGSATGASGSLAAGTKIHKADFTLSNNSTAFTRSGYTYDGWSTNTDGSTKDYNLGGTYTANANITLYPHWVEATPTHTVTAATSTGTTTYGTVSAASTTVAEGSTTTITAVPATGYRVTNWAVSGTGSSISPSGASNATSTTLTMGTANTTVTVTFGPKPYTVTLNNQSATSAGTESVATTYAASTNLTSAISCPTKTGKVFAGYFTGTNGTGVQLIDLSGNWIASAGGGNTYLDGSKNWKYDGDLTLYACWMEYASTFDIKAWVQSNLSSGSTTKTFTCLTTNKLLYSLDGNTELDNSSDGSNAYDGLKFKNSGDFVLFLVPANKVLKLYFGYTDTKPKSSINGGSESNVNVGSTQTKTADQEVSFGSQTYDRLVKIRTVTSNAVVLQKILIEADCSAPAAPTISGTTAYTYGGTISLTATCASGTDASTTYTWYKGSDWATASAASPVQAASTSGATFSKTAEMADAGTYWCEAANSTCTAHNSSGYAITVAKADISPSLSYSSTSLITGDNSSSPTVSGNTGSGTVSYAVTSSSPSGCITVDSGTGVVTAVAAGTGTVTATIAATTNYNGNTCTADFTVTDPCFYADDLKKKSKGSDIANNAYITASLLASGTITGGTLQNTSGGTLGHSEAEGIVFNSNDAEVTLALTGSHQLTAGSVITIKGISNNTTNAVGFTVGGQAMSEGNFTPASASKTAFTRTYTVAAESALDGVKSFKIKRSTSEKVYLNSIKITGCEEVSYYSVTYAAGGASEGSVPVDASSPYEAGETVTVLGNTGWLFKSGYNFAGWDFGNDGVKDYDEDDTFTMPSSNVTLTAVWGSCTKPDTPTRPVIDEGTLTHTGAKFSWDPDGATAYSDGYVVSIVKVSDGSTVLDWTDEGIESEGGAPVYTATGLSELTTYHFIVRAKGASGYCDYGDTARYTFSTLGTPYTITYHLNGASWINEGAAVYYHGTGYTLPVAGDMSNTGYTFGGWYANSGLTGDRVYSIGTDATGNKEYWAKWTENTYTITYDANGGSGSMTGTTGHYVTIKDNGFTAPSGDTFVEWNTTEYGDGASYSPGDEIELTGDMTLYAIWADDYTITWEASAKLSGVAVTPNLGGGNYTITADVGAWNGTLTTSMISAVTDGVTITNVAVDNSASPKTITATFNVGASVAGTSITLELDVPAYGDYAAKSSTKEITIDRCTGSGSGSDGVLFSAEFKDSGLGTSNICAAANTAYTFSTAELKAAATGGSIKAYTTSNLNHMKFATNAISIAGSDGVIQIDLDNAIATNDLFTYVNVNSSTSAAYLRHTSADNTTDQIALTVYNSKEVKVMLPAGYNGKTTLYLVRNNNNFNLHKAAVVRPAFLMLLRDDTPTSDTNLEATDAELTTGNYLATIQGGRAYYTSPSSGNLKIKRSSSKNYINFNNAAGYVKIVLNDALQEGDVIGFDSYNTNNLAFTATATRSTDIVTTNQLYTVNASSALKGKTTFYIWQNSGSSDFLRGLQIARSGIAGGGGGTDQITPTLTWTPALNTDADWDSGNNRLNKETGDADFTYTVTQDKNSLGAISYSSSNTSVATVNAASGKVHIVGGGDATITATIAESGCYEEATATYAIHVVDNCDDVAGTIEVEDLGCEDGYRMTVTGHTAAAGVSYQWYKVGSPDTEVDGATSISYTTKTAGEYYVIVTNTGDGHCSMVSANSITITASVTPTATKIVNSWYIKNGRRTPDIALVQTTNAENFQVKKGEVVIWDTKEPVTTGYAGCSFYLATDGIIYLMGQKPDESAPSGLTAGDETLKFIVSSCGGTAETVSITIHKQEATTRPSVAFVVDGTKEGTFDAENEDHSVNTALYQFLDYGSDSQGAFDLTGQNVYSTVDEKAIREHYSQFDAILITDDPSTDTKIGKVSCVNAFGTMIDVRPILTMEAFVSKWSNWKAKGIDGNPSSPNPRQYAMKLDCKNHAIFVGIDPASSNVLVEDIDGVEYWTVTMVDKTQSPYSGVADDTDTDGKPALQGFSASDVSSLMLLGEISNGTLYAGVERQEEAAARLLLLGLNNKALPNALTLEGKKIIENSLTYLLETDMEKVDDCSNYFTDAAGDKQWNNAANWTKGIVPNSPYVKARILKPCVLSGLTAKVARVDIASSGKSLHLSGGECSGSLTIDPTGALISGGAVRSAEAPYFNMGDLMPTEEDNLILNTSSTNQAALIFNNDKGDTKATVNLYSLGRKVSETNQFQYMAIPMGYLPVSPSFANETYGGIKIYTYVWLEASGWERRGYYADLYAFEGVGITTDEALPQEYTMKGTLTSTKNQEIPITAENKKLNLIGNSWTAPIQISELEASDFGDASSAVEQTVYIYCTGHGKATSGDETETAGQWLAIPFNATDFAAWEGLKVIPSMQSFQIKTTGAGTLTLDYKKHVRGGTTDLTAKLRAPKRKVETDGVELMRIRVADSQTHTDLYLFEGDQFTDEFDNGWEANYRVGTSESAKLYARVATGVMSVAAMPSLESTPVYFIPGQETEYMFTFGGEGMGYYLNDIKMQRSTLISTEATYSFTYEKGDAAARFYISKTPIDAGDTPTGWEGPSDQVKAQKIIYDNKLYIIVNGALYDATGKKVNSK